MAERVEYCVACGKASTAHDGLMMTCRKVQKLRYALIVLLRTPENIPAKIIEVAAKALEETK